MQCRDFGKFTLLNHMGKGGVANVYRANDNEAGNIVAIKIFEPSERRSSEMVRKLRDREVEMLISMQHPNVVKYYESGSVGDSCYYTMEFVENSLLKRMRSSADLPLVDRIHILRQTCNALQAIHHQGIVHRDIKPGNVLLDEAPSGAIHVKVTDLGIAKHVSETDAPRDKTSGKVPGTPKYLSPEQISLQAVDGRADIFSLGVVAYELLAGTPPFEAGSSEEYLHANVNQEAEPLHHVNEDIPSFINPMVERMLAKDRESRYDSDTLARDLELTYQHMVSDAPLVEKQNPESVYYVPPVPEQEAEEVTGPVSKLWRYAVVAALVMVGAAVGYSRWPSMPVPPEKGEVIDLTEPHLRSPAQALERAEELLGRDNHWQAMAVLSGIDREEMNQSQLNRNRDLMDRIYSELADNALETGLERLEAGAMSEAEVLEQKIRSLFPRSEQADRLAQRIQATRERYERDAAWRSTRAGISTLVDEKKWEEALSRAEELLDKMESPDRIDVLRSMVARCLREWQRSVLQKNATPEEVRRCIEVVEAQMKKEWLAQRVRDRRSALQLLLALSLAARNAYEQAMAQAEVVLKQYPDTRAAENAAELRRRIIDSGALRPLDLVPFSREVETNGFRSTVWYAKQPDGGSQKIVQDVLVLTQKSEGDKRENLRSSVRPVRPNMGFDLRVEFRVRTRVVGPMSTYAVGLRIKDRMKNELSVGFDGDGYDLSRTFGGISGGRELRESFGDEGEQWHELGMRYQYDLGKLEVLIDGESVGEYEVELGVFRIHIFTRLNGEGECQAAFRKVKCTRP